MTTLPARVRHQIDDLRHHWCPPYRISVFVAEDGSEIWSATPDEHEIISASSAAALRLMLRSHYDRTPSLHDRSGEGVTE